MKEFVVMRKCIAVFVIIAAVIVGLVAATTRRKTIIEEARARATARNAIQERANGFGLSCLESNMDLCNKMVDRAKRNPKLMSAFFRVKNARVAIWVENWPSFSGGVVKAGYVDINAWVSDERIITFLTN